MTIDHVVIVAVVFSICNSEVVPPVVKICNAVAVLLVATRSKLGTVLKSIAPMAVSANIPVTLFESSTAIPLSWRAFDVDQRTNRSSVWWIRSSHRALSSGARRCSL